MRAALRECMACHVCMAFASCSCNVEPLPLRATFKASRAVALDSCVAKILLSSRAALEGLCAVSVQSSSEVVRPIWHPS